MQSLIAQYALGAVVITGAATDLQRGKIPNWLTLPAMAAGLVINAVAGLGLGPAVWGMLAGLAVYFVFFAVGFRGAGDGKLMGAVGAFVGWPHIATVMVVVALVGGVAAVAVAWRRGTLTEVVRGAGGLLADMLRLRWREVKEQSDFRRAPGLLRMPHGPVIAAGTLMFLLLFPR
ncbi:MAG TPA: A24 family peptidase [Bryobacterales bacterium]|nr:A24 family peptidase [Bryobacterales bacterium]